MLFVFLQYTRALLVLKECLRLAPNNTVALLQASKLCFEHLSLVCLHCDNSCSDALKFTIIMCDCPFFLLVDLV